MVCLGCHELLRPVVVYILPNSKDFTGLNPAAKYYVSRNLYMCVTLFFRVCEQTMSICLSICFLSLCLFASCWRLSRFPSTDHTKARICSNRVLIRQSSVLTDVTALSFASSKHSSWPFNEFVLIALVHGLNQCIW